MQKWRCTIKKCNKPADYHSTESGKSEFYCQYHWCKFQGIPCRDIKIQKNGGKKTDGLGH